MDNNTNQDVFDAAMLSQALADAGRDVPRDVNDEDLVLMAEGRLGEVPPQRRELLLKQVASRPELAELLAELRPLVNEHADASADASEENQLKLAGSGPSPSVEPTAPSSFKFSRAVMQHGWKVAALLTLTFGVWSFTAPAPPPDTSPTRATQPQGYDGPPVWRLVVGTTLALVTGGMLIAATREQENG